MALLLVRGASPPLLQLRLSSLRCPRPRLVSTHRGHSNSPQWSRLRASSAFKDSLDSKVLLKEMDVLELERWVISHGFRPAQGMMLWRGLYRDDMWAGSAEELTGLNKEFRQMLAENAAFTSLRVKDILTALDGTRKCSLRRSRFLVCTGHQIANVFMKPLMPSDFSYMSSKLGMHDILFSLADGSVIETVVIPSTGGRTTVCVSSQVGCAMNCQFCYTGRMGLRKHLSAAEIVDQAVFARRLFSSEVGQITNVVFMGMGEPLHNIDNVMKAASIMVNEQGLHFSPRKVTVSTSGLVPQLKRFLRESNCALAVSLNATTDEVRNWIMPINRKYNIQLLLQTLKEELRHKHRYKVLFEYVMLSGVNDSLEDAKRLVELVQDIPCKLNLISFNPHKGAIFRPTPDDKIMEFRNVLAEAGCVVFLRPSRGDDQMAACGQLGKPGDSQAPMLRVPARFQLTL